MTSDQAAYAAGLLEGEGCFDFNQPKAQLYPQVRLESTDHDVVMSLQTLTGGTVFERLAKQRHHKPSWVLSVRKRKDVEPLLLAIRPWMGNRRKARIDYLLSRETRHLASP